MQLEPEIHMYSNVLQTVQTVLTVSHTLCVLLFGM